jgi:hypothetical protein
MSSLIIATSLQKTMTSRGHVYICLFSEGTIKVGRSDSSLQSRLTSHTATADIFNISMVTHKAFACVDSRVTEKALIKWCESNCSRSSGREWFSGISFNECVANAELFATMTAKAKKITRMKYVQEGDFISLFWRGKNQKYSDAIDAFVKKFNPSQAVISAFNLIHVNCEVVRNNLLIGLNEPNWYAKVDAGVLFEDELLFCTENTPAENHLFYSACAEAIDAINLVAA